VTGTVTVVDHGTKTVPRRRVLVTGAAGFVGAHVAARVAAAGHHVLTTDLIEHPGGLHGDLRDPVFRSMVLHWASPDVVVHAAALVPLTRDREGFTSTNVEASRALASDARAAGAERFVLIGSSAVYGIPGDHPITPRTSPRPVEEYGRSKLRAEEATRNGWGTNGLTILRPRTVVGDGRRGIIDTLARWIRGDQVLPLPRGGRHRLQLVHVEDVARIVLHVIEHDIDGTWPVGAPNVRSFDEDLTALIRATGSTSRIVTIPRPVFRLLGAVADRLKLIPFTRWHYVTLGHDFAFDEHWTPQGFTYRYENAAALASIMSADTPAVGTSPHTRSWDTGYLDRLVGIVTRTLRALRLVLRVVRACARVGAAIGRGIGAAATRTDHGVTPGTRLVAPLLVRLVDHPRRDTRRAARSSLLRHYQVSGTTARLGMLLAAALTTANEKSRTRRAARPLSKVVELGGKLRAAHLGAALHEPPPVHRALETPTWAARMTSGNTDTNLLVIGSGPGAAMNVHAAGRQDDIVVVEAGAPSSVPAERHHTLEHLLGDFAEGGAGICLARPLTQIAEARVLGGGSEVNSGFHHDLPAEIRAVWCLDLGISDAEWLHAETEVRALLALDTTMSDPATSVIARGAARLGYRNERIPRWRSYDGTTFTQHGMTRQIWEQHPQIEIRTGAAVTRLETHPDHVEAHLEDGTRIRARRVVVAAGTVNTPRLLIRSGLLTRRDAQFGLHPMVRIVAECDETDDGRFDVDPFQAWGPEGFKFGGAVSTPSLLGAATGEILDPVATRRLRSFYASFRPSGHGGFTPGPLLPWYRYSEDDRARFTTGARLLTELLQRAGVRPLTDPATAAGAPSSVHVFASLPVGSKTYLPGTSRLEADPRISVSDASLLPGPVGVNPQGIVMTLALVMSRRNRD
jgi:nucleoside-diphosphate-sugar epimerase